MCGATGDLGVPIPLCFYPLSFVSSSLSCLVFLFCLIITISARIFFPLLSYVSVGDIHCLVTVVYHGRLLFSSTVDE